MEKNERNLKEEYEETRKKYKLPEFQKLAEDFDIERIIEKESSFLLRDIRKAIVEKLIGYSHFFENLINPASPPMFLFSIIKRLSSSDKEKIKEVYKEVAKLQIKALKIDTIYSEEKEVEFIKESFREWQKLKEKIDKIVSNFNEEQNGEEDAKERGYFG